LQAVVVQVVIFQVQWGHTHHLAQVQAVTEQQAVSALQRELL
jgi:hypothetical protein